MNQEKRSPYVRKQKPSKWIYFGSAASVFLLILMMILIFSVKKEKTNHVDSMIGRIVALNDPVIIGEIIEFIPGQQMIVETMNEQKARRLLVSLDKTTLPEILAMSRKEYMDEHQEKGEWATKEKKESESAKDIMQKSVMPEKVTNESAIQKMEAIPIPVKNDSSKKGNDSEVRRELGLTEQSAKIDTFETYDRNRKKALEELDEAMRLMAEKADKIDEDWEKYTDGCLGKSMIVSNSQAYGRLWFFYGWGTVQNESTPDCLILAGEIGRGFDYIRAKMEDTMVKARKAGLYPGDVRDARKRYFLEWDGWEK